MEKLGSSPRVAQEASPTRAVGPADDLPHGYWQAILDDRRACNTGAGRCASGPQRLDQIPKHLLRVSCRRCARIVEIQKVDAIRLYGRNAVWRDVGQRPLDNTCTQRTGRHEEDGCWPSYDAP